MDIRPRRITAIIGPSGCGKSTLIRCFNRMNELIPGARVSGEVLYHGENIYGPGVDPVVVRRHIGMVFQRPNPFPKSIYDNVAFGAKINGYKGDMDELVERSPAPRRSVGRGQEQAQEERPRPLRRPAAAAVHRPGHRGGARRDPHGRAGLGPRPHRHRAHRGPDAGTQAGLLDHHRDAQHAAGRPRLGRDGVPLHRGGRGDLALAGASWWSSARPARSSPSHGTSGQKTTSRAASDKRPEKDGRRHAGCVPQRAGEPRPGDRAHGRAGRAEHPDGHHGPGRGRPGAGAEGPRRRRRASTRSSSTSRSARWPCWPSRRRWPAICG